MYRNLIFNKEFQNFIIPRNFRKFRWTLDIAWKWAIFCQFCQIGHQFNLIFVSELDFRLDNKKMSCSDANSRAISWIPGNFWKFSGMMEFGNSVLKIKFLHINWVGLITYILKSVRTGIQGPGIFKYPKMCAKLIQICYLG